MTDEQKATLRDLRWHWDDAYLINFSAAEGWTAISMDLRQQELKAPASGELRNLMRDDYARHQPGRKISQPGGSQT